MDIYPLTAEEFENSEKVTSPEVLEAGNAVDVEVEQFFLLNKIEGLVNFQILFFYFFYNIWLHCWW